MTTTRYDLVTPRKGKDDKTYWTKVGVMFPNTKGGFNLSFESLPIPSIENGKVEVRVIAMAPREGNGSAPAQAAAPLDDNIPF